ncbi:MAG: SHOCT domain-containing protein [Acidimicrobiia bacterium]
MSFADLMILLLIWIPLILLAIFTLVDLSHRDDLSSIAVGLWAIAIVLLPIAGMLIYFGTRPEPGADAAPTPSGEPVDEAVLVKLERLGGLHETGVITDDELTAMKMQILA